MGFFEDNAPVGMANPRPNQIPYEPPTGGINPGGMYSGTGSAYFTPDRGSTTGTPAPSTGNQYTDPAFITQKINEGFAQAYGRAPSQEEFNYWMGKMSNPDVFSDGKTRVGWNPYWQARLTTPGSASADPGLAGEETVIPGTGMGGVNRYGAGQPYAGTFTGGGQYPLASVMGSGLMQPWTTPFEGGPNFQAPTDVTQQNDPGWQFRMKEGLDAIQRSAASKGTLLTGGAMTDLMAFGQDFASNEYGNVYNRAASEWDRNYNRALGEYQQAYNIFGNNQANQFGRLDQMSQTGATAASGVNANNSGYGANASNTIENMGNVNAAGTIGRGNAYVNLPGQIVNTWGPLAEWYAQNRQPSNYYGTGGHLMINGGAGGTPYTPPSGYTLPRGSF
jgi:hypothetical protein